MEAGIRIDTWDQTPKQLREKAVNLTTTHTILCVICVGMYLIGGYGLAAIINVLGAAMGITATYSYYKWKRETGNDA